MSCHPLLHILQTTGNKSLTHLSPASFLWDIGKHHSTGKHHSPRCDAAERGIPSGTILFAQRNFTKNEVKTKITLNTPKNESGLIRRIMMGESIRQIRVNIVAEVRCEISHVFA